MDDPVLTYEEFNREDDLEVVVKGRSWVKDPNTGEYALGSIALTLFRADLQPVVNDNDVWSLSVAIRKKRKRPDNDALDSE